MPGLTPVGGTRLLTASITATLPPSIHPPAQEMTTAEVDQVLESIDFGELEAQHKAKINNDYANILIIGNLPAVNAAKEEKLLAVLKKNVFGKSAAGFTVIAQEMPKDPETGLSKGFLFLELESQAQADAVFGLVDGYKLDKTHTLFAVKMDDYERLLSIDPLAEYTEEEEEVYEEKEHLKWWMLDSLARDQLVCQSGHNASVYWNNRVDKPELCYQRANWTERSLGWSPRGSYLCTVHNQGIALWGGKQWNKVARFPHPGVVRVEFSPTERYLVTFSPATDQLQQEYNVMVWEIASQKVVRGYRVEQANESWPYVRFSSDDKYAARATEDMLVLYEVEEDGSLSVIDKKPLQIEGIRDFAWSPSDPTLAYWTPGSDNSPARVALMEVPSRHILRTKNLFNVVDCRIQWHSDGDYLGVQVTRTGSGKSKKQALTSLELFRLRQKDIPVDVLDLTTVKSAENAEVLAISFEPLGERVLVAVREEFKVFVSVYALNHRDKTSSLPMIKLLKTLERKQLSRFIWSPRGDFCLFAGLESTSGFLEFWSINDFSLLNSKEHFTATDAEWDPSGRFVATFNSYTRFQTDNGLIIWDFRGEQLSRTPIAKLSHVYWRPRPRSLLSREQQKAIKKNLKAYSERFELEDRAAADSSSSSAAAHKAHLQSSWAAFKMRTRERADSRKSIRDTLMASSNQGQQQQKKEVIEEWVEEVIEETEEVIR